MPPAPQALGPSLTAEQQMLVDTCDQIVGQFVERAPHAGDPVERSADAWHTVVDVGLPTLCLDEDRGGGGADLVDLALVVDRLAQGPLAVPLVGTALASALLAAASPEPGHLGAADGAVARGLDALVAGRPGSLLVHPGLELVAGPDALTGPAALAFDWAAGSLSVGLSGNQVLTAVAQGEHDCIDLTRRFGTGFDGGEPVGSLSSEARRRFTAQALVLLCADLVGAMTGALDVAVAHAVEREQFGRPIGSFQAVQQLCADQLVTVASARSITRSAAEAFDGGTSDEALHQARVAKAYCAEHAVTVCEAAIQVWGGIGMTWECPAHLFLRRALLSRRVLGDEHVQFDALVDQHLFAGSGGPR